jgi:uncharacterized membrane protein
VRIFADRKLLAANVVGIWALAVAGLVIRAASIGTAYTGYQRLLSYTDTFTMWAHRGIDQHAFPYVNAQLTSPGILSSGTVEYPVLLGLVIWATALLAHSYVQFLVVTTVLNALAATVVALLLIDLVGRRSLWWSWSPAMLLFLPYNWDALPALATVVALWIVFRAPPEWTANKRAIVAAIALGIGCALKIYPGLLLLPLTLWLVEANGTPLRRAWREMALVAAVGGGIVLAINLPFMLINMSGWLEPFSYQSSRTFGTDALSSWLIGLILFGDGHQLTSAETSSITTYATLAALAVAIIAAVIGWRRRKANEAGYPIAAVSTAMVAGFILANKVNSPQYILWVLPLLVLVPVSRTLLASYIAANTLVFLWFFTFVIAESAAASMVLFLFICINLTMQAVVYVSALKRLDDDRLQLKSMSSIPAGSGS